MASPNPDTITDQESRFVEAYLVLGNGKQAAVEAGYSPRTAAVAGSRLLRRKRVKMAIDARQIAVRATAEQKTGITFDRLLHELATAAFCDPGELFGPKGRLLTLEEMPERLRRAIKQCDVLERIEHRDDVVITHRVTRIRFWDKLRALELIAKLQGHFESEATQDGAREYILRWASEP
jgi:phage terminase small subunit